MIQIIPDLIKRVIIWKLGVHRLTVEEFDKLNRIKHKGLLVEAIPSKHDKPELSSIVNFLIPIHSMLESKLFSKLIAFEIWCYKKHFSFLFFSKDKDLVQQIISQVNAIYPNAAFKETDSRLVPVEAGAYISSATVQVEGSFLKTKPLYLFEYDPLSHILEAMSSDSMLQVIFRIHKISEKLKAEAQEKVVGATVSFPYFRILIRIAAFSQDPFRARLTAEQIASSFAVFNANNNFKANLPGLFSSIDSFSILKKMVKRSFPWFFQLERRQTSILCAHEIASFVHLPI